MAIAKVGLRRQFIATITMAIAKAAQHRRSIATIITAIVLATMPTHVSPKTIMEVWTVVLPDGALAASQTEIVAVRELPAVSVKWTVRNPAKNACVVLAIAPEMQL